MIYTSKVSNMAKNPDINRPPFQTRTILLRTETQRETALALIPHLPLDSDRPLEMVIREQVKARGLDQNGYYFMRIGEIAEQAWLAGRQYSKNAWHEYAKNHIMPEEITTKDGEVRSKWEPTPDGEMSVISTTQLERKCFAEYTTAVEAFGAELGVMFSVMQDGRRAA